jgi:hypothetical protein
MVSASWSASSNGCQVDYYDEVAVAIGETVSTQQAFRKVVLPGSINTVGFQISPGEISDDMPIEITQKIYSVYVEGSYLDIDQYNLTPQRFSLVVSINNQFVEFSEGALQIGDDIISIVSTTSAIATCLLKSSPTYTRVYSWFCRVEPITTTAINTKII